LILLYLLCGNAIYLAKPASALLDCHCDSKATVQVPALKRHIGAHGGLYQRALIRTHGPFPPSDGHDLPGLIDEFVPGFATQCDDFVVGLEYPVG